MENIYPTDLKLSANELAWLIHDIIYQNTGKTVKLYKIQKLVDEVLIPEKNLLYTELRIKYN